MLTLEIITFKNEWTSLQGILAGKLLDPVKWLSINSQLNYNHALCTFLIILPSAKEKWWPGKVNRQEAAACFLVCLILVHERSSQCVYLCLMFTIQNELVAKEVLLTGHNLQWRGPKVKMPSLCNYCTYSVSCNASPLLHLHKRAKIKRTGGFINY